jgi:hypothetical protein
MDVNDFFKFFIGLLVLAIVIFWFLHSDFEFECPLPKGGYYKVKWLKEYKKFKVFHWQPKEHAKPLPKDSIVIQGEKEEPKEKPSF